MTTKKIQPRAARAVTKRSVSQPVKDVIAALSAATVKAKRGQGKQFTDEGLVIQVTVANGIHRFPCDMKRHDPRDPRVLCGSCNKGRIEIKLRAKCNQCPSTIDRIVWAHTTVQQA